MISVIAPNLNDAPYLRIFLDSLVAQTFKDFELIIIDGGSTDSSLDLLAKYARRLRLKVLTDMRRNFGYLRNLGASYATGAIMLHCNTDNYLEPQLLEKLYHLYKVHPNVVSIGGRVYPIGTSLFAHLGYQAFDFLRFLFTIAPMPIKKYRPSGNFMSIRSDVFWHVGGHPEVRANEDGLLGQKLDTYVSHHKQVMFSLNLYMGHYMRKFEQMGGLNAILFYFYVLGNFAPILQPLLKHVLINAELVFEHKPHLQRLTLRQVLTNLWHWL